LSKDVKPAILSCFGDIALAISGDFEKYLSVVMPILQQASQTRVDLEDYDQVEYLNSLREGILEAYTGIIQGLRESKAQLFLPYVNHCVSLIEHIWQYQNRTDSLSRAAVGVLGDISHALQGQVKSHLHRDSVRRILADAMASSNSNIRTVADWAHGIIFN